MRRRVLHQVLGIAICACLVVTHSYDTVRSVCCQPKSISPISSSFCATESGRTDSAEIDDCCSPFGEVGQCDGKHGSKPCDTGPSNTCGCKVCPSFPFLTTSFSLPVFLPYAPSDKEANQPLLASGFPGSLFRPPQS